MTYKEKIEVDVNFDKSLQNFPIIEFFKKNRDYKKYEFQSHQYVTTKITLFAIDKLQNLCIDFEIFMFLINQKFINKEFLETKILTI